MTTLRELLRTAAGTGELVTVAYNGGSHPGQPRKLVPLSVELDELIAVEQGGRFKKHYKLFKIAWVELSSGERVGNTDVDPVPAASDVPQLKTFAEYAALYVPELKAAGWHVYQTDTSVGLATFFKNGKPRKTPDVSIHYIDPSSRTDFAIDRDAGELLEVPHEVTGRERPWNVYSWRVEKGKSFGVLWKAVQFFITEARAGPPPGR